VLDVIRFDFNPAIAPFGLDVRLETLALAAVVFFAVVVAALGAGQLRARYAGSGDAVPGPGRDALRLRRDDLILIAFGAVPGAVVGGRLDYVLIHLDYFSNAPGRITDPSQGGLALTLAVVVGAVTGLAVARLLAAPISRWLHVAAVPLLLVLGVGKMAMVLGGDGQGQFSDAAWATAYLPPGPWQSANAGTAALPSQAVEGILVLIAAALILVVPAVLRLRLRRWRRIARPGIEARRDWSILTGYRRFLVALWLWSVARFAAAFTWRDAQVAGPLRTEQVLAMLVFAACSAVLVVSTLLTGRRTRAALVAAQAEPIQADLPEPRTGMGATSR
jgi:prolipoprotein diacylglyceryltransferase